MKRSLKEEKLGINLDLEASLSYEDETDSEFKLLKYNLRDLESAHKSVAAERSSRDCIINVLNEECTDLNRRLKDSEAESAAQSDSQAEVFVRPKAVSRVLGSESLVTGVESRNRFSVLATDDSLCELGSTLTLVADVHVDRTPDGQEQTRLWIQYV